MTSLNGFDITVIAIISIFALYGVVKGFVRIVLFFVALMLASKLALMLLGITKPLVVNYLDNSFAAGVAAFIAGFIGCFILLLIINGVIIKYLSSLNLGVLDKSLGVLLGAVGGVLISSVLYWMIVHMSPVILKGKEEGPAWFAQGKTHGILRIGSNILTSIFPDQIGEVRQLAEKFSDDADTQNVSLSSGMMPHALLPFINSDTFASVVELLPEDLQRDVDRMSDAEIEQLLRDVTKSYQRAAENGNLSASEQRFLALIDEIKRDIPANEEKEEERASAVKEDNSPSFAPGEVYMNDTDIKRENSYNNLTIDGLRNE